MPATDEAVSAAIYDLRGLAPNADSALLARAILRLREAQERASLHGGVTSGNANTMTFDFDEYRRRKSTDDPPPEAA